MDQSIVIFFIRKGVNYTVHRWIVPTRTMFELFRLTSHYYTRKRFKIPGGGVYSLGDWHYREACAGDRWADEEIAMPVGVARLAGLTGGRS